VRRVVAMEGWPTGTGRAAPAKACRHSGHRFEVAAYDESEIGRPQRTQFVMKTPWIACPV